jgi:hypothetical protein
VDTLLKIPEIKKILRNKARTLLVNYQLQKAQIQQRDINTYLPENVLRREDYPLVRDCTTLLLVHDESLDEDQYGSIQREANRYSRSLITHISWLEDVISKILAGELDVKGYENYLYHGVKLEKFLADCPKIRVELWEVNCPLPTPPDGEVRIWTIERILAGKENHTRISKTRFAARLKSALKRVKDYLRTKGLLKDDEQRAGEQKKDTVTNAAPLATLKNPVACVEVGCYISKRPDNIATSLKNHNYSVVKSGRKNYCNAEDAGVLWPKWKKHWQLQKSE